MKPISIVLVLLGIAVVLTGCTPAQTSMSAPAASQFTLAELLGRLPARDTLETRWVFNALLASGPDGVYELCMKSADPEHAIALQATYAVSGLATFVTGQGRETGRTMFVGAVARALQKPVSPEHAAFLMTQLQTAGRAESLEPLSHYLGDERLCEPATQAMLAIGGDAGKFFFTALPASQGKPRLTIIRALGETRTAAAVGALIEESRSESTARSTAALTALAAIGDAKGEEVLSAALKAPTGTRSVAIHRLLAFANRRAAAGDASSATRIATDVLGVTTIPDEGSLRVAALDLLVRLDGERALDKVFTSFADTSAAVQGGLLGTARYLPGSAVTGRWVNQLAQAPPPARVRILTMLGERGDVSAFGAVVTALNDNDGAVRQAAINAAIRLDAQKAAPALLKQLARSDEAADVNAVRDGLSRIPAAHVAGPASAALSGLGPRATVAIKSLAAVAERNPDREARAVPVINRLSSATPAERPELLKALARIGGTQALRAVAENGRSKDPETREAALRALTDWSSMEAFDSLIVLARSKEKLPLRVLALRACVRLAEAAPCSAVTAVRYHERTLAAAERIEEKRLVLGALANINSPDALRLLVPYITDDSLGLEAAMASWKIAKRQDDPASAEAVRRLIEPRIPEHFRAQAARVFDARWNLNDPPEGFKVLFNGKDLAGWKGLVGNPVVRAKMTPAELAAAQAHADSVMRAHWSVVDGTVVFDGKGESLCTLKDYMDFEMLVDWKIEKLGDSGIYLRGSPQVQIWDPAQWPEGSGGLYNNQRGPSHPLVIADKPIGEWNTFRIRMVGDRVSVYLNNVLVVDSVALENYWDRSIPIFPAGQIELQSHSAPLYFRNVFIREIPRATQVSGVSVTLMNGKDLTGWEIVGGKPGAWDVKNGVLSTQGEGGGWLSTMKEYGNFQLDLDFRVVAGGNSGVFIRSPREGDPAYTGMEIQVLDDYAAEYATLKPWQYTGSVYGVQAPAVRATKKADEWQHIQITAQGPHVAVVLNDRTIVDADLLQHMDKEKEHPGLKRRAGFIGLQNHSTRVEYRNITIRELE